MKRQIILLSLVLIIAGCQSAGSESQSFSNSSSSVQTQPETAIPDQIPLDSNDSEQAPNEEKEEQNKTDQSATDTANSSGNARSNAGNQSSENLSSKTKQENSEFADRGKIQPLFAFANTKANRLLIPSENAPKADSLQSVGLAVGPDGSIAEVKFAFEQKATTKSSGRMTADNFEQAGGFVFDLVTGKLTANQTYFLIDRQIVPEASLLSFKDMKTKKPEPKIRMRIEQEQERMITDAWSIAELESGETLVLTEFVQVYGQALATLSLVGKDKMAVKEFTAQVDANSTWRLDDGGKIHPELFKLIFAARSKEGFILGVTWGGAEGERQMMLLENADELKEPGESQYRYWSPM